MNNSIFSFAPTALALALSAGCADAATIQISSRDGPGVGFNDPTGVAPVGGNPGTTLGEQRMNVYKYVAGLWEKALASDVVITVSAGWEPLTCSSSTALLGTAGPWNVWHDFPGGKPGTWYPAALADKLAGTNLAAGEPDDGTGYGNVDIKTQFNINLGQPGCLDGAPFYLGLDGQAGPLIDFVETLEHELGHGLGFGVITDPSSGFRLAPDGLAHVATGGLPGIWDGFLYDNAVGKTWLDMSNAERQASAVTPLNLAWKSAAMVAAAKATLAPLPVVKVATPAPSGSGLYPYATASFGRTVAAGLPFGVLATVPPDVVNGAGCLAYDATTAAVVKGKVAIVDRGNCSFVIKAKNAQAAGAVGVIIANNVAGPAASMGGSDPTVQLPIVGVSQADGVTLKSVAAVASHYGSRTTPGQASSAFVNDPVRLSGADLAGRPLMFTPNPLQPASSVSHWDTGAFPNLLMEPNINPDLTVSLVPPLDLTKPLLVDLGW